MSISTSQTDWLATGSIFVIALLVFWFSPVHQLTDSNYSMLLSESLLKHRSFTLDSYNIPRRPPRYHDNTYKNGELYQLELVGPHLYYYMPPGSSVLSLPYVAVMNAFGVSAAYADGTYNPYGEEAIEAGLAAILMAALASIFFFMSRLVLPLNWSLIVALAGAFATQLWSTASRALWSDTWGILLLGIVVWMLLRHETERRKLSSTGAPRMNLAREAPAVRKLNPIALATLLAWSYFVRPTNVISILAITVYLFIRYRKQFVPYAITGTAWFVAFVAYSWYHFHQLLPNYFLANRLSFGSFWTAFAGNLISPSRGLFVFVPVLLFVVYLFIRYRRQLPVKPLASLALAIIAVHLVIVAGFTPWNGGFCYGPRYTTGVVPWFVLLSILSIRAMLAARNGPSTQRAQLAAGTALLLVSVILNARGATSQETWTWNNWPTNVDKVPGKIWDWRQPQFLAGLVHPPLPREFALLEGRINFAAPESDKYLWYGWSWREPEIRWSDGREATVVFAVKEINNSVLQIRMGPFLIPGKVDRQRVDVVLNGQSIEHLVLTDNEIRSYPMGISKDILKSQNILTLNLPDAASPKSLKAGGDLRKLGVKVEWIELQTLHRTPND
jgi:hypothetical protein